MDKVLVAMGTAIALGVVGTTTFGILNYKKGGQIASLSEKVNVLEHVFEKEINNEILNSDDFNARLKEIAEKEVKEEKAKEDSDKQKAECIDKKVSAYIQNRIKVMSDEEVKRLASEARKLANEEEDQ